MLQEHWRIWTCPFGCPSDFQNSNDSRAHKLEEHMAKVSIERVEDLVSLSSNTNLTCAEGTCPLCLTFDIKSSRMYESHVGKHLEQLALFVLPQNTGDESEQDDSAEDDWDGDWKVYPEEEQMSDVGSEESNEVLVGPGFETKGDFEHGDLPTGVGRIQDSKPEDFWPQTADASISATPSAFSRGLQLKLRKFARKASIITANTELQSCAGEPFGNANI